MQERQERRERRIAEQQARQERLRLEQQAEQERRIAEQQARQERLRLEQQARQERLRLEQQARQEQLEAERLAKWNEYIKTHFCEYDLCRWCKDNPDIWEKRFTEYMANKRPTFNTNLSGIIKPITKKK